MEDALRRIQHILGGINREQEFHSRTISLTSNENYPSKLVRSCSSFIGSSFYNFEPPMKHLPESEVLYPLSDNLKRFNRATSDLGSKLYGAPIFDWRPNSGSLCEISVLLACCSKGEGFVHFSREDGGHFALDAIAEKVGIENYHFETDADSQYINLSHLESLLKKHGNIRLVILDQSHKLRMQPIQKIAEVVGEDIVLAYDCSHDGLLIATGVLLNPLQRGVNILHGNSHKTIPGPQKGYLVFNEEKHFQMLDPWIFPNLQSNCHAEHVLSMYFVLSEIELWGRKYAEQIVDNAKSFATELCRHGFDVSGKEFGYTETNQVHLIIGSKSEAAHWAKEIFPKLGIRINNILIPQSNGKFGFRIGVQALTRRGFKQPEFTELAKIFKAIIIERRDYQQFEPTLQDMLEDTPLFPLQYSFDSISSDLISEEDFSSLEFQPLRAVENS